MPLARLARLFSQSGREARREDRYAAAPAQAPPPKTSAATACGLTGAEFDDETPAGASSAGAAAAIAR